MYSIEYKLCQVLFTVVVFLSPLHIQHELNVNVYQTSESAVLEI